MSVLPAVNAGLEIRVGQAGLSEGGSPTNAPPSLRLREGGQAAGGPPSLAALHTSAYPAPYSWQGGAFDPYIPESKGWRGTELPRECPTAASLSSVYLAVIFFILLTKELAHRPRCTSVCLFVDRPPVRQAVAVAVAVLTHHWGSAAVEASESDFFFHFLSS